MAQAEIATDWAEWLAFLGRFHLVVLHLPIGLFFGVLALHLAAAVRRRDPAAAAGLGRAEGLTLALLAAFAPLTALLGLALASEEPAVRGDLWWHQWLGISAAVLALAAAWARLRAGRRARGAPGDARAGAEASPPLAAGAETPLRAADAAADESKARPPQGWYRLWLGALAVVLIAAGHYGGSVTHGRGFLTARAPAWVRQQIERIGLAEAQRDTDSAGGATAGADGSSLGTARSEGRTDTTRAVGRGTDGTHAGNGGAADDAEPTDEPDEVSATLAVRVAELLDQRCVRCHGEARQRGRLRLDMADGLPAAGKSGRAPIVPGDPWSSELVRRITLPLDTDGAMPPVGPRISAEDALAVIHWIYSGAELPESK